MNADGLLLLAQAYGTLAQLLAPLSDGALPEQALARLHQAVGGLGRDEIATCVRAFSEAARQDPEGYRREYLRLFVRGEAPPYEASPGALGGPNVQVLADVAGFYRAFGMEARGERPDHLAAELEFLALLCVKEAHALLAGQPDRAQVCAEARANFLRDHLASWLPAFETSVTQRTTCSALRHLVELVVRLVRMGAGQTAPSGGGAGPST